MTIASEITRLQNDKACICAAIENKGVTVWSVSLDCYASCIDAIPTSSWWSYIDILVVWWGAAWWSTGATLSSAWGGWGWGAVIETKFMVEVWCSYCAKVWAWGVPICYASNCCTWNQWCSSSFWNIVAIWWGAGGQDFCGSANYAWWLPNRWCNWAWGGGATYRNTCCMSISWYWLAWWKGGTGASCRSWWGGWAGGDGSAWWGLSNANWWIWISSDISWETQRYGWWGGWGSKCASATYIGHGMCWGWDGWCCCNWCQPWCNATYYGWGGWGAWQGNCAGYYTWWRWCQWIVIVRYANDGSYWINSATGWNTCYECNWYCIHCFTSDWTFTIVS